MAGIGGSAQCRWVRMYTIGHEDGICEIRNQELCLDITGKDPVSLKGITKDNLKTALLECYKAFSYDGHKN